jgi:hemin uptake protein HemP
MNENKNFAEPARGAALDPTVAGPEPGRLTRIDAHTLLGNAREVILVLQGSEYRLRLTSKGKLILTK